MYCEADLSTHGPEHSMCDRINARVDMDSPLGRFSLGGIGQFLLRKRSPSTDLPESSVLGLSFSEPVAEKAEKLWTPSGALHGHHPERFTFCPGALYYAAVPTSGPPFIWNTGTGAPNGLCVCHSRQGPSFGVRREVGTVPCVLIHM
jgi:hypothetical protein